MCNCIEKVNENLESHGQKLPLILRLANGGLDARVEISLFNKETDRPERRKGKHRSLMPRYCPFCGEEYGLPA